MKNFRVDVTILAALLLYPKASGQPLAPEVLVLAHASRLAGETAAALENCVCLESVARSRTDKKSKPKPGDRDTLQIEVTTIGNHEWFSWPGAEDTFVEDPRALVNFGLINTGQSTSILKTVLVDGFAVTHYRGVGTFRERPALQFDYSISSVFTHYLLRTARGATSAGMRGSFWLDPQTAELLALSNEATEIPPDFEIQSARIELLYAPMYLEDRRVVLPQTAVTVVENSTGVTSINQVEFSHCHPYTSTSSIHFDGDSGGAPSGPVPDRREPQPVPAGLSLRMRLSTPLTARTAVGERLALIMEADARSRGDKIVAKGARVEGRVRWIETSKCPARCLVVAMELLSVTAADGTNRPVYASLDEVSPDSSVRLATGTAAGRQGTALGEISVLSVELPPIPGVGSFLVLTPDLTTPPDLLMTWSTGAPHHP